MKMTVGEFYSRVGADYGDILRRLGKDERILRFLGMLRRDDSFSSLCAALEAEDYDAAFRAAHTLKGIALNLGLTPLAEADAALTEALRGRQSNEAIPPLFEKVRQVYLQIEASLGELLETPARGEDRGEKAEYNSDCR